MKYHDSYAESQNIMQQALKLLDEHELAYNPVNYAVAYQYATGDNFQLMSLVEQAINEENIDPYLFETLFQDLVLEHEKQDNRHFYKLDSTIEKLHTASANTTEAVDELDHSLQRYQKANHDKISLREVVNSTERIKTEHANLVEQVMSARTESEAIKAELLAAKIEAITDPLTGLQNRQGLTQYFNKALQNKAPLVITSAMLDIDYFKKVNDTFGHLAGDLILKRLGKVLNSLVPATAQAFRFGGEEFVIILKGLNLEQTSNLAEAVRSEISRLRFKSAKTKERLPPLTISIGITQWQKGEDLDALLVRADEALYTAKNNGRNQVVVL
ncbi:MAG: GGDEF domain-containing protein [Aestuariibacter sp.]